MFTKKTQFRQNVQFIIRKKSHSSTTIASNQDMSTGQASSLCHVYHLLLSSVNSLTCGGRQDFLLNNMQEVVYERIL